MSKKLYEESNIQDIADAIREKNGEETTYKVSEMAQAILDIDGGTGDMPNLDNISFGNNPTVDNPGYTNPQYYEDIADAINYAIEHGGAEPINILHPKSYSGSVYNSPDPNVSILRASDDAATVTFNGTKVADLTINYQLQIPYEVIKTFVGCKVRAVSNDSRVNMHIQKMTSPYTFYGGASHGDFVTIPSISDSDVVFCIDIKEVGEYNNVTAYLEVFGVADSA